jgi:uncharacterized protein (TIGR00369 family)
MPVESFETAVRETFARQKFMATLGAKLVRVAPGEVDIELPLSDFLGQQNGAVHAGVLAAIADSACGGAALTRMPPGSDVTSVEFKLNLLAPAIGERLVARARVIRAGRTLTVCMADVIAMPDETVVATMLGTMMTRTKVKRP